MIDAINATIDDDKCHDYINVVVAVAEGRLYSRPSPDGAVRILKTT